ncbi:MAG: FHA domain-containing protein [Rhizobacter sp.]
MTLVKRCPGCATEHPPGTLRCDCGLLLVGVDLVEPAAREAAAKPAANPGASPVANRAANPVANPVANLAANVVANLVPTPPPVDGAALVCRHPDCAQTSPAGSKLCNYCNRALTPAVWLKWPWGERELLGDELWVGRVAPAPAALVERLARDYDNVSRRHAVLRLDGGGASVEDLGSSNGTFVNDVPLPAHRPLRLHDGAKLRFGASLVVSIDAGK